MAGVNADALASALDGRGVNARRTGDDSIWVKVGDDYQAEVRLRAGVWWLHTPAVGEATHVAKAVGKAATVDSEQLADRLVDTMRQHWPIRLTGAAPTARDLPAIEIAATGPLGEVAAVLAGPTGLAGRLHWESGPGWTQLVMTGGFGSIRLSADSCDYFLDMTLTGDGNHTFVVGRFGEEAAAAHRAVATVRALVPDPRRAIAVDPVADLTKVLIHLPGQLEAEVVRTVGGDAWIRVPGSRAWRSAPHRCGQQAGFG